MECPTITYECGFVEICSAGIAYLAVILIPVLDTIWYLLIRFKCLLTLITVAQSITGYNKYDTKPESPNCYYPAFPSG